MTKEQKEYEQALKDIWDGIDNYWTGDERNDIYMDRRSVSRREPDRRAAERRTVKQIVVGDDRRNRSRRGSYFRHHYGVSIHIG